MTSFGNRIRVSTATAGTGTVTLGSAVNNSLCTFAEGGINDGETVTYLIEEGNDFEIGRGVYTASGTTMSRATVILSKISGSTGTTKMTLAGAAKVRVIASADDFLINEATPAVDVVPYFTSTTAAGTTPLRPGGKALAGLTGSINKIPYFTGNTSSGASTLTVQPAGMALLQVTQGIASGAVRLPYLTSNTSGSAITASFRPTGIAYAALLNTLGTGAWAIGYVNSNTATSSLVTAAKPSGLGWLGLSGLSAKWQIPYLTSNTISSPSVTTLKPGGIALLSLGASIDQTPYFTGNTESSISTYTITPSGRSLSGVIGAASTWKIPYLTSNTSAAASSTAIKPSGMALIALAGTSAKWMNPYLTSNTSTASATSAVRPGGIALWGTTAAAGAWVVPYLTSNTETSQSTFAVRPGGQSVAGLVGVANSVVYFSAVNTAATMAIGSNSAFKAATASRLLEASTVWDAARPQPLSDAAHIPVNLATGINYWVTLAGNRVLDPPTGATKFGQSGTIKLRASTSTRTLTANSTAWKLANGVESSPFSITTTETVLLTYFVESSANVWITSVLRRTS